MTNSYEEFLAGKSQHGTGHGFEPVFMPDFLFDFQKALVEWAVRQGRCMIAADCGLGKTPMQLVWAENVIRKTGKPVLIATPLAVGRQVLAEAKKFGMDAVRSGDGVVPANARIVVTNYERVHKFKADDFGGMVCDESSILKNYNGVRRAEVTELLRTLPYRLLCTATAAPNDYIELGTSSEALGELGHVDMLTRFFKNEQNTIRPQIYRHRGADFAQLDQRAKWRFKGHAEVPFWKWVCSWARACRRPSDLGFSDDRFALPPLIETEHPVDVKRRREGMLFDMPSVGFREEREERRRSIVERCERVAALANHTDQVLVWCDLNDEGDALTKIIHGAEQVSGSDSDDDKESRLAAFADGTLRALVSKPKIGAWGLNLQRCSHVTFFPSHSYEQYYHGVRRCWRFGQTKPVRVDIVSTEGSKGALKNLQRKAAQADRMFSALVANMNDSIRVERGRAFEKKEEGIPWLSATR